MKGVKITDEQRERIYDLLAKGVSPEIIADDVSLSIHTIRDMRRTAPFLPAPKNKNIPLYLLEEWDDLTRPYRERRTL